MSPTAIPGNLILQSPTANDPLLDLNTQPSLDLQFATSKTLDDAVSGTNLITFSRASTGTYVDSDGLIKTAVTDAPRFDHDPVTGESLGLLIEESRTNYIDNSNDLSQWNRPLNSPVFDANTTDTLSPDGTYNSTKITGGTNSGVSRDSIVAASASTPYTASFFAKKGTADNVTVELGSGGNRVATNFNISTKTFSASSAAGYFASSSLSYVDYPNGWVRVIVSGTTDGSASGNINLSIYGVTNGYAYFWGAQVEANASFPTSYIPTTGSTVTRAADVASIEGTNFSSWFTQNTGTVFVEASLQSPAASGQSPIVSIDNSGADFRAIARRASAGVRNTSNADLIDVTGAIWDGEKKKIAATWVPNDCALVDDGVLVGTDTSTNSPLATVNQMQIGQVNSGGFLARMGGHISRLAYFPYRLADATLQEITS